MLTVYFVVWIFAFAPLLARVPMARYAIGYMESRISEFELAVKSVYQSESDDFIEVHNTLVELTALLPHVFGGLVNMRLKVDEPEKVDPEKIISFQKKLDTLPGMRSIIAEIYAWMCIAHFFGAPYKPSAISYGSKGLVILLLINRAGSSEPTASGRPETVLTMDRALRTLRTGGNFVC